MATANIQFHKLIQDSQEFGSDDQHMVSRIFFTITVENKKPLEAFANIKQTVGTDFETAPLEVSKPVGYGGPFNYEQFRILSERYYRGVIGSQGIGISVSGATNVRMRNNTFQIGAEGVIEVPNSTGGTW